MTMRCANLCREIQIVQLCLSVPFITCGFDEPRFTNCDFDKPSKIAGDGK